jgi:PAS domain S-box-containing protein
MIEPDLTIRWRVSVDGTGQEIVGTSVGTDGGREEAYRRARETVLPQVTPGLELRSGGFGIAYVAAIYEHDRFRGYTASSIRAADLLDIASEMISGQFTAMLTDDSKTIAGASNGLSRGSSMLMREREIAVLGQGFTLTVWPEPAYLDARRSYLPRSVLLLGLMTVGLITLAVLLARRGLLSKQRADALANRLAGTLEHISDGFMMLDRDWRITYWNGNAARISGVPVETAIGSFPWESFPKADGRFAERYKQAQRDGQSISFTDYFPPIDRHLEVHAHPLPDGMAVYFRDVTGERRREEQLRLLENAVSRQNDIVIITETTPHATGAQPPIIYVNAAFTRLTGYTEAKAIGATPSILFGPSTQPDQIARIEAAMAAAEPVRAELLTYTSAGEELWLDLDIVPLSDDSGEPTHLVAVARDITDRRRFEVALASSEERFRLASLATRDVLWDWDLTENTVWWSEAFTDVFGETPQEANQDLAGNWAARLHPDDQDHIAKDLRAVIRDGGETWTAEYRAQHADGRYLTVVDHAFVIRDDQGRPLRAIGSLTDVTAQRDLESRIRQSQKMEAVGQLTGGVAHDFNNLLTVILGNADQLDHALADREDLRMLARMTARAAERGSELTGRLLAFARRQALQPRPTDVNQLLNGMERLLNRSLTEQTDLKLSLAKDLWPADLDPGQLEVALLNLTINARDAMQGRGGRLTIETANAELDHSYADANIEVPPGPYVMISVTDTGDGMAPDVVARAFEPFFTTKDVGKGSGLGLSMVYGFVKQSGGHAKIYSEPGHGTTIRLYFPRSARTEDGAQPIPANIEVSSGRESVLVVEDDRLVREHAVALLTGLGYQVTGAENGIEALEILKRRDDFDLLFTDVVMPGGVDGRQLADAVRELRPGLKVLFTSGYAESAIVHHGRLDAGVQLLSKPYRRQELAAKLREVLKG